MGYSEPLPTPSPTMQATIASIVGFDIHEYIQVSDKEALLDKDKDGKHASLLLSTLDLFHWTSIMFVSTTENGNEKVLG